MFPVLGKLKAASFSFAGGESVTSIRLISSLMLHQISAVPLRRFLLLFPVFALVNICPALPAL